MKKLVILLSCTLALYSCKKDQKTETDEPQTEKQQEVVLGADEVILEGEYIYVADAAVLKGKNFIYGVVLDNKASELAEKIAPMKKEQYDMVPVKIAAVVKPNPAKEGWEQVIEIKQILEVYPVSEASEQETIKINSAN